VHDIQFYSVAPEIPMLYIYKWVVT